MISSPVSKTKRILSGALAVWLSGVVFLVCCGVNYAKPALPETASCPLAKKGHCSQSAQSEENEKTAVALKDVPASDCCAFLSFVYNKSRKTESSVQIAELPGETFLKESAFVVKSKSRAVAVIYRPPIFDRTGTYVKNRVFRI